VLGNRRRTLARVLVGKPDGRAMASVATPVVTLGWPDATPADDGPVQ